MSKLIKALQIFLKYGDIPYPTHCSHEELIVCVDPSIVSDEDKAELEELGFYEENDYFQSFRYGSA